MDYDLEQKIAPEFIRYSLVRHRADMSFMHKCKEQPAGEKVAFYEEKIKKRRTYSIRGVVRILQDRKDV